MADASAGGTVTQRFRQLLLQSDAAGDEAGAGPFAAARAFVRDPATRARLDTREFGAGPQPLLHEWITTAPAAALAVDVSAAREVVDALLHSGSRAHINAVFAPANRTPLMLAADRCAYAAVQALLEALPAGADAKAEAAVALDVDANHSGGTALHAAAARWRDDAPSPQRTAAKRAFRALLLRARDPNVRCGGRTPLHAACAHGNAMAARELLSAARVPGEGVDADARTADGDSCSDLLRRLLDSSAEYPSAVEARAHRITAAIERAAKARSKWYTTAAVVLVGGPLPAPARALTAAYLALPAVAAATAGSTAAADAAAALARADAEAVRQNTAKFMALLTEGLAEWRATEMYAAWNRLARPHPWRKALDFAARIDYALDTSAPDPTPPPDVPPAFRAEAQCPSMLWRWLQSCDAAALEPPRTPAAAAYDDDASDLSVAVLHVFLRTGSRSAHVLNAVCGVSAQLRAQLPHDLALAAQPDSIATPQWRALVESVCTPLQLAVRRRAYTVVSALLAACDDDVLDVEHACVLDGGATALHYACRDWQDGLQDDLNAMAAREGPSGLALAGPRKAAFAALLGRVRQPNAGMYGDTAPLHVATAAGNEMAVKQLLLHCPTRTDTTDDRYSAVDAGAQATVVAWRKSAFTMATELHHGQPSSDTSDALRATICTPTIQLIRRHFDGALRRTRQWGDAVVHELTRGGLDGGGGGALPVKSLALVVVAYCFSGADPGVLPIRPAAPTESVSAVD